MGRHTVKITESFQQLAGPFDNLWLRGKLSSCQKLIQTLSVNIVHYGINHTVLLNKVVDLRNIGVA